MELIPLALNIPLLLAAAFTDLRNLRISNELALMSAALFILTCPLLPMPEIWARLLAALLAFAAGFVLFIPGVLGGGDVKFLSVFMLFVPSDSLIVFSYIFSFSLIAGIAAVLTWRGAVRRPSPGLAGLQAKGKLPMGLSIALAGLLHFGVLAAGIF